MSATAWRPESAALAELRRYAAAYLANGENWLRLNAAELLKLSLLAGGGMVNAQLNDVLILSASLELALTQPTIH